MQKTWLDKAGLARAGIGAGDYFYPDNAEQEISGLSDRIAGVTKKGYMSGYRKPQFGFMQNHIFKTFDRKNCCQMVTVQFR